MNPLTHLSKSIALLALGALAAACSVQESTAANTTPGATPKSQVELVVYAATSTRDVLQALAPEFEKAHAEQLVFSFGSSGDLAKQIVAAGKADVFLSADDKAMDEVEAAKLVAPNTRRALLSNQLVVIEPTSSGSIFSDPFDTAQLANAKLERLSLGNVEAVPAGRYAKAWLEKHGVWSSVEARVLPGVDVRAALAAVESGGAQAGIVYATDAARSQKARIIFRVPLDDGPKISYPIAVIAGRANATLAREFVEYLVSNDARKHFESFGFLVVGSPSK